MQKEAAQPTSTTVHASWHNAKEGGQKH